MGLSADSIKITDKCMTGPAHDTVCDGDLKCICQVDNHLGTNKLFSSDCLLKECTDGHGRKCRLSLGHEMAGADYHSIPERLARVLSTSGQIRLG